MTPVRRFLCAALAALILPLSGFAQAGALRDYVGLLNQTYHPDIVSFFEKMKANLAKKGETDAVKAVELFLKGAAGSGFVVNDARGNLYVLTNNHVVAQAYTLAITFERQDGYKRTYGNLKIIAADEANDLALLSFAAGDKPAARGLSFLTRPVEEGEDVFSAGFPGLGATPLWQFGRGMVSNAFARFPKSLSDETLMGPFIQHTAQVDPGNSGGPLLAAQASAPGGYAVAGINTLSALWRQAANYAIPVKTVETFMNGSLNPRPDTFRAALDERLAAFVEGLGANKAAYPHIAEYLSSVCVGENAEYAIMELFEKAGRTVQQDIINRLENSVVGAMGYAVGWTIESSVRSQGAIKAALKDVSGAGEEYTVVFTINNKDYSSRWIREYGNWRIRTFGSVAAGDKQLLSRKERRREASERLRTDSAATFEAGYAYLFDKAPAALYVSADYQGMLGAKLYFAGSDLWALGGYMGRRWSIPAGNLGFSPYIRAGVDFLHDQEYEDFKGRYGVNGFSLAFMLQGGLRFTTSYVPGLSVGAAFQYNIFNFQEFGGFDVKYDKAMKMAVSVTAGYSF
ncbi:MAG: serine protease [Treponema sp.]|jgi:serine protease Do|nr:serine protease [Treponema sp.]